MTREDLLGKMFEAEFCEPGEKAEKFAAFEEALRQASEERGKPAWALKTAFLKVYPAYRAKRLSNEIPNVPPTLRGQKLD